MGNRLMKKQYKLKDIGAFKGGVTSIKPTDYGYGTPFITYKNIFQNPKVDINMLTLMNVPKKDLQKCSCKYGDIFFTASSEVFEEVAMSSVLLDKGIKNLTFNGFSKRFRLFDFNTLLPEYAVYYFRSREFRNSIAAITTGDIRFNVSQENLSNITITLPPLSEQKRIANILSSFDNKIEILKKENKILEDIAQNIFKEWFVKYNFPNKDGKPYKDNGGQMIDSELGPIPEGWRVGKLGEYFPVTTGKRNANHARENGEYMFFTCSQDNLLCDEYSFNNGALLLAGNGDFNIKWYKGKFDAYQRTYVLIPYNQEQLGYLFFLMKHYLSDIIIGNRGSVISFITKGMIEDFTVFIPNEKIEKQANKVFSSIIQQQAQNDTKINVLTKTKNTLIKDLIK